MLSTAHVAKFKGTVFTSTRAFTEHKYGPLAVEQCLATLEPADRILLDGITAVGWYPVEPILKYHRALEQLYGKGSGYKVCEEAGRFSAEWSLNSVLKMFLRLRSPHWLIQKHGSVWNRYHDSGRWEASPEKQGSLWGRLSDFEVRDPAFCARLSGWLRGAIEATGGKNVRVVESTCRSRDGEFCQFDCTWK